MKKTIFLLIFLSVARLGFSQLCFFSTNENVLAQPNNLEPYSPDLTVSENTNGTISLRDPRAAVFAFQNPHTQGKLIIEEIKTSDPNLVIINPPTSLAPGESGKLVAFYKGKEEVKPEKLFIEVRSNLKIELTNQTVQTLSVQIQTNQIKKGQE